MVRATASQSSAAPAATGGTQGVRLMSVDAFRGFVMLAMASAGLGLARVADDTRVQRMVDGSGWEGWWRFLWQSLKYQSSHVEWTGCAFWDLIQPGFMFLVGVALPFSSSRRHASGESEWRSFRHAMWRAAVLVVLGVLLSSSVRDGLNFTFVNVLTQIGLGYLVLYLLQHRSLRQLAVISLLILAGYGAWFALHPIDAGETQRVQQHILERQTNPPAGPQEWSQFQGWAAHWNKHTNAAAQVDRRLLNWFPRLEEPWMGRGFWFNRGGYQTLNFIPSLATMIFGLMAGKVLSSGLSDGARLRWLLKAGLLCFVLAMGCDTTIWPTQWLSPEWQAKLYEYSWSACPVVKRIWTPTWALFSTGWTMWLLAVFYWVVDVRGFRRLAFPLAIVGLNSIAVYGIAQLFRGWLGDALKVVLKTVEQMTGASGTLLSWFDSDQFAFAPIVDSSARLLLIWLICLWMYRRNLYVRI